jgi:two-component system NtrC family sensor kinase
VSRRTWDALRERVKELTCLYGLARTLEQENGTTRYILQQAVDLLPPAWHFPELAVARITLDGEAFATEEFEPPIFCQSEPIVVSGTTRGAVEVGYCRRLKPIVEQPFLPEERSLIEAVAREISLFIERREAAQQRDRLEEQLRHADRLATIGKLAAGVAHEINEPLGAILGFAQLSMKSDGIPAEVRRDLDQIVTASLHAREIVKKLMLFSRQTPPRKSSVDLNRIVEESLSLLAARCAEGGIDVVRHLAVDLLPVWADPVQIQQIVVNLLVNAMQALHGNGTITVATREDSVGARLIVEDTGCGMAADVKERIFDPFFTTKDVGEGTGLGLSLVHGIVTAHGGSIEVESSVGRGSRFEIRLPRHMSSEDEAPPGSDYGE